MTDWRDPSLPQRTLTDADISALAEVLKGHTTCNLGLTPEEVGIVKHLIRISGKACGIVGAVVLSAIVLTIIAIFSKGFWASLLAGAKAGGLGK